MKLRLDNYRWKASQLTSLSMALLLTLATGCPASREDSPYGPSVIENQLQLVPRAAVSSAQAGSVLNDLFSGDSSDPFKDNTYLMESEEGRYELSALNLSNGQDAQALLSTIEGGVQIQAPFDIRNAQVVVTIKDRSKLTSMSINGSTLTAASFTNGSVVISTPMSTADGGANEVLRSGSRLPGDYALQSIGALNSGGRVDLAVNLNGGCGLVVHLDVFGEANCWRTMTPRWGTTLVLGRDCPSGQDSGPDATHDATADVTPDAPMRDVHQDSPMDVPHRDAGPDTGRDATPDSAHDAVCDAPVRDVPTRDVPTHDVVDASTDAPCDVHADSSRDSGTDSSMDASHDACVDSGVRDTGTDVRTDVCVDSGVRDTGTDVRTDVCVDSGVRDTGTDVGADVCTDVRTDAGTDVTTDSGHDCGYRPGCTRTIGYWKNHAVVDRAHPERPTVDRYLPIWLGTPGGTASQRVETVAVAVAILDQTTASNGITKLRAQLLGTKLSLASGAYAGTVMSAISNADAFLATHAESSWSSLSAAEQSYVNGLKNTFDSFNNGALGVPHCD